MAKVAAVNHRATPRLKREHKITCSAAEIEHACAGPGQNVRNLLHGSCPPIAIDIEREQMIQQVVTRRDAAEHAAHPSARLLLVFCTRGRGALAGLPLSQQASASSMTASTSRSSTSDLTFTAPIRSGSTKCILPFTVFLSLLRRPARRAGSIPLSAGNGP